MLVNNPIFSTKHQLQLKQSRQDFSEYTCKNICRDMVLPGEPFPPEMRVTFQENVSNTYKDREKVKRM